MKEFKHTWDKDVFLLHIQLANRKTSPNNNIVKLIRKFQNGEDKQEEIYVDKNSSDHRFIVSRSHPRELGISILYPMDIILEAFKIDDRAYYPTESFFVG